MTGGWVGDQDHIFYVFCLDGVMSAGHLLGRINAVLDLRCVREALAPITAIRTALQSIRS